MIITLLFFIFSFVSLYPGIYILLKNPKNITYIIFFGTALSLACFLFTGGLIEISDSRDILIILFKIFAFCCALFHTLMLNFILSFTNTKVRNSIKALPFLYLLALLLILSLPGTFTSLVVEKHYKYLIMAQEPYLAFSVPYNALCAIVSCYLLIRYQQKTDSKKDQMKCQLLIYGIVATWTFTWLCNFLLPDGFSVINHYPAFFFMFNVFAFLIANLKYRLWSFKLEDFTRELIANLQEMIIILNPEQTIAEVNAALGRALGIDAHTLIGKKFAALLADNGDVSKKLDDMIAGKYQSFQEKIIYRNYPENIVTDSQISCIRDKYGDLNAILIISKENTSLNQFRRKYKISTRQMEIIRLSSEGLSNAEICKKLNLSRRTIETHLFSIYSKLDISNKVELIKLINQYNLVTDKKTEQARL